MPPESSTTQHYLFAHVRLRDIVLSRGRQFPELVRNQTIQDVLDAEWRAAGDDAPASRRTGAAPTAAAREIPGHDVVLVTMPPPEAPTEAHFAAITVRHSDQQVRYLLLEHSVDVAALLGLPSEDGPRAVMAEWTRATPSGGLSHVNFGDSPVLPEDGFLAEVERLVV